MAIIKEPNKLPGAFAWDGDKNTIPDNNDGQSGLVSIAKGFPNITQIPLEKGGIPPQRADFNGIFNLFSQFLLYLQNGGVFTYSSELDYTPPAIVADTDGNIYKCLKENGASSTNGIKALTETEYWLPILKSETVGGANQLIYLDKGVFKAGRDISDIMSEYLPLTGGTLTGLVQLATSIASNITTNIPLDDSSGKLAPTAWVQAFVSQLSQGLEVTSDGTGHFKCPALGITGLMAQNGYIALGKLFGGLIIQWINDTSWSGTNEESKQYTFPVSFPNKILIALLGSTSGKISTNATVEGAVIHSKTNTKIEVICSWNDGFAYNNISIFAVGL